MSLFHRCFSNILLVKPTTRFNHNWSIGRKWVNLINHQRDIEKKTYLHAIDPCQAKYKLPINKRDNVGSKHCHDRKAFIEYSSDMDKIYENIDNTIQIINEDINRTPFFINNQKFKQSPRKSLTC